MRVAFELVLHASIFTWSGFLVFLDFFLCVVLIISCVCVWMMQYCLLIAYVRARVLLQQCLIALCVCTDTACTLTSAMALLQFCVCIRCLYVLNRWLLTFCCLYIVLAVPGLDCLQVYSNYEM